MLLKKEIWKGMYGYEGSIKVSSRGRVYIEERSYIHPYTKDLRKAGGFIVKQSNDKDGYKIINVSLGEGSKNFRVHRMVLQTFRPVGNMDELEVNHKDGVKYNNKLENLEWVTSKENTEHAIETGLIGFKGVKYKHGICQECKEEFKYKGTKIHKYCGQECYFKGSRKVDRVGKDELYNMLKEMPFTKVGEYFGISDNAIRRWCLDFGIPSKSKYYREKYRKNT